MTDHGGRNDARGGARKSLERSEEMFRLLVESVRDYAIFILDTTGHVVSWNAGAERIKGYKADEIIGQHFSRFYEPEEIARGKCDYELEVAAREGRFEDEGWRVRKDGARFWANVVITALRDDHGTLVGFAKVTRDLSERRKAEQERIHLAQVEEANRVKDAFIQRERDAHKAVDDARRLLATTLRSIGDGVITTDARGVVTTMNPVAEALTGLSLAEATGKPFGEVFRILNEQTRRVVEDPVVRVIRDGIVVGLANHTVLLRADGTETPIADSGAPIRDEDGKTHGVVVVFRDATEEKTAAVRRSFLVDATAALSSLEVSKALERVASLAVPSLADWCAAHVVDEDGALQQVAVAHVDPTKVELAKRLAREFPADPAAPRGVPAVIRTGHPELYAELTDEILQRSTTSADQLDAVRALLLRSCVIVPLTTGARVVGALTLVYAESGRRYDEDDLAFAVEFGRRAGIAIENARLYAAEQRARENADTANRAKDEFLAAVSHELRTPLTSILGWAKMLTNASLEGTQRTRAVDTIERNAVAMTQLIEDLLDVSRIVSGKMRIDVRTVELVPVIEAALDAIKPAIDAKAIVLDCALDRDTNVRGDAARLQQVVWNLVSNAVKFTPRGGHVRVALRSAEGGVEIVVSDDGKGIEPRFLPHVFEAFRQAEGGISRAAGGLGLGLAITKHLIELHGGTVDVRSEGEGRGATFTVKLPKVTERTATQSRHASASTIHALEPLPQLKGLHVLMVDDEEDARQLVRAVLEYCGSIVTTASSAAEALEALRKKPPDVLVSDIGMPGESGFDLIKRVRALPAKEGGDVPAAALTAYARAEDRRAVLGAGFMMHVPKPVDPAELVAVVGALARLAPPR